MSILIENEIKSKQQALEEEIEALQTAAEVDSPSKPLNNILTAFGQWMISQGRRLADRRRRKPAPTHLIKKVA